LKHLWSPFNRLGYTLVQINKMSTKGGLYFFVVLVKVTEAKLFNHAFCHIVLQKWDQLTVFVYSVDVDHMIYICS